MQDIRDVLGFSIFGLGRFSRALLIVLASHMRRQGGLFHRVQHADFLNG